MRYLGIDYGTKRVGLSVSDEEGAVAFPKEVVPSDTGLIDVIGSYITDFGIGAVVLGKSHDLSGTPNPVMGDIDELKEEIERTFDIPVHLETEVYTSSQARRIQGNVERLDASAAALILQSFLDKNDMENSA